MASLLRRKFVSLSILFPSSRGHNLPILTPLFHFSSQFKQKEDLPFIAQYLIASFGFSEERAIRISTNRNLSPIKTPDRPESVVRFLKDMGLSDIQIKHVISSDPYMLSASVSKTLERNANEVIAGGFTRKTLIKLIQFNSQALTRNTTVARLQFWRNFIGKEEAFLKVLNMPRVINMDLDKEIIPRINLLREYGLSDKEIAMLVMRVNYFLFKSPDSIKSNLEQIEKLGFPRESNMFLEGLVVFSSINKDTFDRKVAFFKMTYGWSTENISSALRKFPKLFTLSQENVRSTMDFLIEKVGVDPRSIAMRPVVLSLSLERRLIPRHYVLTMLKSKGVLKDGLSLYSMCMMSEKQFVEKFILAYGEEMPELGEAYAAARHGKMHVS